MAESRITARPTGLFDGMYTSPEIERQGSAAPVARTRRRRPFLSTWVGRALVGCGLAFASSGWALLWAIPRDVRQPAHDADDEIIGLGLTPSELG
jgi:hypothetical protein